MKKGRNRTGRRDDAEVSSGGDIGGLNRIVDVLKSDVYDIPKTDRRFPIPGIAAL